MAKKSKKGKKNKKEMALVIDIHMIPVGKNAKKTKMMHGGMANNKKHSYAAGGAVVDKMEKK